MACSGSDEPVATDFVVMRLDFPERGQDLKPTFSTLSLFTIPDPVMNVFLLDTTQRLLAAFVYLHETHSLGLYCLLDWNEEEYVFIDTNIRCVRPFHDSRRNFTTLIISNPVLSFQLVVHRTPRSNCDSLRRQRRRISTLLPS
jgi:hypothetical protein